MKRISRKDQRLGTSRHSLPPHAGSFGPGFPLRVRSTIRPGFTLMEVMLSLALLAAFMVFAGRLLLETMRVSAESQHHEDVVRRFDSAVEQLRLDVWSARQIESDGQSATLRRPDGSAVVWRIEPEPPTGPADPRVTREPDPPTVRIVRTEPSADPAAGKSLPGRWDGLPEGLAFEADGPSLRVLAPAVRPAAGQKGPQGPGGTDRLTLVSQFALAGGTR